VLNKFQQHNSNNDEKVIDIGSVVIWDAHYCPNLDVHLEKLADSPYFRLVKEFKPEEKFKVFGRDYQICVFERIKKPIYPCNSL
jgi:hypothetical protein